MRLSEREANVFLACGRKLFEGEWTLELFGSRVEDHLRGGDIDLLFTFGSEAAWRAALGRKAAYLAQVKTWLGEQKIDVVMTTTRRAAGDPFVQSLGDRRVLLGDSGPHPESGV